MAVNLFRSARYARRRAMRGFFFGNPIRTIILGVPILIGAIWFMVTQPFGNEKGLVAGSTVSTQIGFVLLVFALIMFAFAAWGIYQWVADRRQQGRALDAATPGVVPTAPLEPQPHPEP